MIPHAFKQSSASEAVPAGTRDKFCFKKVTLVAVSSLLGLAALTHAQVNGVGQRPYLGWSSFSQQTLDSGFLTQANIIAQSDAMASSGIQAHGFNYINID